MDRVPGFEPGGREFESLRARFILECVMSRQFPHYRARRLRSKAAMRDLVREHDLSLSDCIYPIFVTADAEQAVAIPSLPGERRYLIEDLPALGNHLKALGLPAVALFPQIHPSLKTPDGQLALDETGLIPNAIAALKSTAPDLLVIADVALDPYTSHGQDGLLNAQGQIDNDATLEVLVAQSLVLAGAGADIVAPSDMMDGRIGMIRAGLESSGFVDLVILSYAAKYASHFYGPFRVAVGSEAALGGASKHTYQMDYANVEEAYAEVSADLLEGADIVMVKPAMPYLDVITRVKNHFQVPVFAYQVSGEYAMLTVAIQEGLLAKEAILESLIGIKRAGASAILTYFARQLAESDILGV